MAKGSLLYQAHRPACGSYLQRALSANKYDRQMRQSETYNGIRFDYYKKFNLRLQYDGTTEVVM
jgi:hypothetical protein